MSDRDVEILIRKAAVAAVQESRKSGIRCEGCGCRDDPKGHEQEHDFVREAIETMRKINNIKWGVAKAVAIAGVISALALIGIKIKIG